MQGTATHLVDRVLPRVPMRQWVLSLPRWARFLLARDPRTGAVTFVQRFGGALNLNVHFHCLVPALGPDLALDSSGGAVVSWLGVTAGNPASQIPHTAIIARWRPGGLQVIGSFPATGFLSTTDKASLAFDAQDNLYVAVPDGDFLAGPTNIYRYGK
jgi:hypothetical protein